jgi:acylphosphatase
MRLSVRAGTIAYFNMSASDSDRPVRAHIVVSGLVQGVGYRAFAARSATRHGLLGGVRNLPDGRVKLDVEGQRSVIDTLLLELRVGPPAARVEQVEITWSAPTERHVSFSIWY